MNVLLLTTNYHPVIGGAESYARELARGLVRRGHTVTVFTDGAGTSDGDGTSGTGGSGTGGSDTGACVEDGVRVIRDTSYRADLHAVDKACWEQMAFCLLPALSRRVDLSRIDVIHANGHDMVLLGSMLKFETGLPLVATLHEFAPEQEPIGTGRCRLVYGHLPVDTHIAVSRFYRDKALGFGARSAELIYLGVDTGRFRPRVRAASRRTLRIPERAFLVSCVARLKERKGLREFVTAAATFAKKVETARFVIAGTVSSASAGYAEGLHALIADLGLRGRFEICTDLSHDAIPDLLAASDVVVQPSYAEGLGLAVLEAMACRIPVVAADTTGLSEIVEHGRTGLLVPPRDSRSLADGMLRLAGDADERERLADAALEQVRRGFTLDAMVAATERVYADLPGR